MLPSLLSFPLHPSFLFLSLPPPLPLPYLHYTLSLHAPSGDFYHYYLVILYQNNGLDWSIFLTVLL